MESSKFTRGDEVRRHGSSRSRGIVMNGPIDHGSGPQYDIEWVQPQHGRGFAPEQDLEPFGAAVAPAWAGRDDFLAHIGLVKLVDPFTDVLLSMGWSRTEFHPYQFIPALQFVQHARHGLLIADEVGLGKTIEAALVLRELMARGRMDRVLVVCPANLRSKWRGELLQRFDLRFELPSRAKLKKRFEQASRENVEPSIHAIVSFESIRWEEERTDGTVDGVRHAIEESGITFDLVIFDEAHHMRNAPTKNSRIGRTLSEQADHVLLLSATPLQTDRDDLLTLLRLLEPSEFGDMNASELGEFLKPNRGINAALEELSRLPANPARVAAGMREAASTPYGAGLRGNELFSHWLERLGRLKSLGPDQIVDLRRTLHGAHTLAPYYSRSRKREVQPNPPQRRPHVENVQLDEREQAFYNALIEYLKLREGARPGNLAPSFAVITRERIAASCLRAARDVVEALLDEDRDEEEDDDALGYEGADSAVGDADEPFRAHSGIDADIELAAEAVRATADDLPDSDGKMDALVRLIRGLLEADPSRKMLVFTAFRGTLSYLEDRLEQEAIGFSSVSGGVPVPDRPELIERFREDPDQRVLLSTEVAAEGVDLQFCNAVINYDLPWNPMRVEQRIGRIDRFGQESPTVAVASFNVSDTIDSRILDRLYQRINVFEESIGELEPIFRQAIPELQAGIFTPGLTPAEQEQRANTRILQIQQQQAHRNQLASSAAQLLGHAPLLMAEIRSAEESGRYVSAAEAEAVVRKWIAEIDRHGSRLEPGRRPGARRLSLDRVALDAVRKAMADGQREGDGAGRLIDRLATGDSVEVTFERETAARRRSVPFLHIGHPIVRAAVELLRQVPDAGWLGRMSAFRLPPGRRRELLERFTGWGVLLVVFRLAVHDGVAAGAPELRIVPIAVDIDDHPRELPGDLAEQLMGLLPSAEPIHGPPIIPESAFAAALEVAPRQAEQRRLGILEMQRISRKARVAQQRETLRRTYGAKIGATERRAAAAADRRIKRMHETRLRNLRAELEDRLAELRADREPTADIQPIAAAVFTPA